MMGYREYARHRGCSLAAVQKAIKTGRIAAADGCKIDPEDADRRWAASTDPAKQRKEPPAPPAPALMPLLDGTPAAAPPALARRDAFADWEGPWPPPPAPVVSSAPPLEGRVTEIDSFQLARAERERAEAELAKIKLLEAQDRLIDADEARQTWQAVGAMFGRARENVPVQLATLLAGKTDLGEIERTIRKVFREADERIADEIEARFVRVVGDVRYSGLAS